MWGHFEFSVSDKSQYYGQFLSNRVKWELLRVLETVFRRISASSVDK